MADVPSSIDTDRVLNQAIHKTHAMLMVNCVPGDRLPDGEMVRQMRELLGSENVQAALAASGGFVAEAMRALDPPELEAALSELRDTLYGCRVNS